MMHRHILSFCGLLIGLGAAAQFPPPAGQPGTTAMHQDSSAFVGWATGCTVQRGPQDISNEALGNATTGNEGMALGMAGSNGVVSLGDGGEAVLTFADPISNGPGWDFAVFENGFDDHFLELAFVEVSSNGIDYFRFPATSNTQTTVQVDGFGATDATRIDNLAGKYRAGYGTPFDLEELSGEPGLDIAAVTHVKVIDVVGCIQEAYATHDRNGNIVNDPWSTPFASSGFDLDAVGVVHHAVTAIAEPWAAITGCRVYPDPVEAHSQLSFTLTHAARVWITVTDVTGRTKAVLSDALRPIGTHVVPFDLHAFPAGIYFVTLATAEGRTTKQVVVDHE